MTMQNRHFVMPALTGLLLLAKSSRRLGGIVS